MNRCSTFSRRDFIATTSLAASIMLVGLATPALAVEGKRWPVGCRDMYLKYVGQPDSWSCLKAIGGQCTEVNVGMNMQCVNLFNARGKYTLATDDGIRAVKDDMAASGCTISAFLMANTFDEALEDNLAWTRKLVKVAQTLGVKAIRIDVAPRKLKDEEFLPFAINACKQMCQIADGTPVRYGVENHGKLTNNPEFLEKLFDGVGSEKLGWTMDCANFYWWGMPLAELYAVYQKFAPRAVHTHCKSIRYPDDKKNIRREMGWEYAKYNCPIYEGDLDFKRIVKILRDANYQGDLCVEDESLDRHPADERADVLRKEIKMLKGLE